MESIKKLFPYYHNAIKFLGFEDKIYKSLEPMNHIIDNIYLGDFKAADNLKLLQDNKITHIINCAYNLPNQFPSSLTYLNLDLQDIPTQSLTPKITQAYDFIKDNSSSNILIHCVFGASRSGSVTLYYLMKEKHLDFTSALAFAKSKRSILRVNPGFESQLHTLSNNI